MGAFDGSVGAFVIGTVFACFLTGITSAQCFQYYQNFPKDRLLYKNLVAGLFVLDTAHTAVSIYTIWDWCVANYGDVQHLLVSPWSFAVDPIMVGIVAFTCQGFYAYRVWVVGKRQPVIPVLVVVLAFLSLGFALGATVTIITKREFAKFQSYTWGVSAWLALAALSDVIITATLVYHLNRSKTGLLQTNSILNRLIELVISTNGLTAVVAVIDAILFGTLSTSWHVSCNLALPKLYFNSLLVSLNARVELERRLIQTSSRHETHRLDDLPAGQALTRNAGTKSQTDVRTALGFGAEDCDPDLAYAARKNATRSGIHVTTHQTVISDGGVQSTTYLPSADSSEKDLPFYNEKELEASRAAAASPIRTTHFSPEVERAQRFPG
ncbi:DUF6534 domain-containing protein [Sporobolomyces salmoneus]|uniref:DUF6534 domain-containing protein n=1 Tax=Sporobolomyces salmoneus TaxID=183962 RepID=UPI00317F5DD8